MRSIAPPVVPGRVIPLRTLADLTGYDHSHVRRGWLELVAARQATTKPYGRKKQYMLTARSPLAAAA